MKPKLINWESAEEHKNKLVLKTICNDRPISIYKSSYIDEPENGCDLEISIFTAWFTDKKEKLASFELNTFFNIESHTWFSLFESADNYMAHCGQSIEDIFIDYENFEDDYDEFKYDNSYYDHYIYFSKLFICKKFRKKGFGKHLVNCVSDSIRKGSEQYDIIYSVKPYPIEIQREIDENSIVKTELTNNFTGESLTVVTSAYYKENDKFNIENENVMSFWKSCGFNKIHDESEMFIFNF
jgi:GNAT superfamily N-acetyltransferase